MENSIDEMRLSTKKCKSTIASVRTLNEELQKDNMILEDFIHDAEKMNYKIDRVSHLLEDTEDLIESIDSKRHRHHKNCCDKEKWSDISKKRAVRGAAEEVMKDYVCPEKYKNLHLDLEEESGEDEYEEKKEKKCYDQKKGPISYPQITKDKRCVGKKEKSDSTKKPIRHPCVTKPKCCSEGSKKNEEDGTQFKFPEEDDTMENFKLVWTPKKDEKKEAKDTEEDVDKKKRTGICIIL